ncbi:MAG: FecR domain-containing protein [Tannerella sp.]|jgi:ferric-dicitrate binding protein FerR (iron transport regulator)|nr:FecR domain-containing protein [Tannerella sp.]
MKIDQHILIRYFAGDVLEEEKEGIRLWLESDESHRQQFVRERIRFDASLIVDESEIQAMTAKRQSSPKPLFRILFRAASVVIVVIVFSYFYGDYKMNELSLSMQNVYVPSGSRTSLMLAEGSTVWLNSNTTMKYPGFFQNKRVVELDGEGFFDVAKDAEKPFIINAGQYKLEVLGTSFNIESYNNGDDFEVALFTGKLKLHKTEENGDTVYLNAGETATLIDGKLVVSATNFNKYRWKEGLIVIEDESFEEIMLLFEKYFDVKVVIQTDKVKKLGYWGKFRIVDGIDHALRVLQNDFRFAYKREEQSDIIYIY